MIEEQDHLESFSHIPVMSEEVMSLLKIISEGVYVDGTIGLGGHSESILSQLSHSGHLIGIDRDVQALEICRKRTLTKHSNFSLFNDSYSNILNILDQKGVLEVNGMLLDLGLSSFQLDNSRRGFSFKRNENLDMRFDNFQKISASDIINKFSEKDIADIIFIYGEERLSRKIARKIVQLRPITTTFELVGAIQKSTPPKNRNKTIARVFQAIRIIVNDELKKLEEFLDVFYKRLCVGGRVVLISFHSLEDRMIKHKFKTLEKHKKIRILTKKPLYPTKFESTQNRRSRSAKLRAAEKI